MGNGKTKLFIDSNIWFSVFYKKGTTSKLLEKIFSKNYEVVISELVLEELFRNIKIKAPKALNLAYRFFREYPVTVVKNPVFENLGKYTGMAQKKDLPILTAALDYQCQYLVTGNLKDFSVLKIRRKFNLIVINPREMLELIH
jgi:putative PIN family toxin of toxin-antitoxin system